jgi:hypothetical protein
MSHLQKGEGWSHLKHWGNFTEGECAKNEYKSAKMSARDAESCEAESKKRGFNPESGERQRIAKMSTKYKNEREKKRKQAQACKAESKKRGFNPESGERQQRVRQNPSQKTASAS